MFKLSKYRYRKAVWMDLIAQNANNKPLRLKMLNKVRLRNKNRKYELFSFSDRVGRCIYIYIFCQIAKAPPYKEDAAKIFRKFWELENF